MSNGRRRFLEDLGFLLLGGVTGGALFGGCSSGGLPTYRYTSPAGTINLYLDWYPELVTAGGAIQLVVTGRPKPVVVVRFSTGSFTAVSPECPYDGCVVRKDENQFRCPCDGSRFALDGKVISGPAGAPLESYRTEYKTGIVKIFL